MKGLRSRLAWLWFATLILFLLSSSWLYVRAATPTFADQAFNKLWEYTDAPVSAGRVQRSWYWGPQPGTSRNEPYSGSKSGTRLVQYFDKARMEINDPNGDRSSEWFVTTGLLVAEMVSGKQQVGNKEYAVKQAAEIAVGGDGLSTDPEAPTYTSFRPESSLRGPGDNKASNRTGQAVTATINRAGQVGDSPSLGLYPGAKIAAYSDALGHNIPQAMWDFLNLKGVVRKNGADVPDQTLANWVFVMGYPISEPYWARVKIDGVYQDALFQMYERRSLAYVPAMAKGWQVQMGNVGAHYYRWIYGGPLPSPIVPVQTPRPSPTVKVPMSKDAAVVPSVTQVGATIAVTVTGMAPGEKVAFWLTPPDSRFLEQAGELTAGSDGSIRNVPVRTTGFMPGLWAVTYEGLTSHHQSIAFFYLAAPGTQVATATRLPASPTRSPTPPRTAQPTATVPSVATQPAGGLVMSVQPGYGPPGGQFTFSARGLRPGENVQVKFTDPAGAIVYPQGSNNGLYSADASGRFSLTLQPDQAFPAATPGVWLWELGGLTSGLQGVVGFTLR